MFEKKWTILAFMVVFFMSPMMLWANVSGTNISVGGSGSGNATGTSTIVPPGDYDVPEDLDNTGMIAQAAQLGGPAGATTVPLVKGPNLMVTDATIDPSGTAEVYMSASAQAWDGTADANASGTLTESDGVSTATIAGGSVTADATKEWDPNDVPFDPQNPEHVATPNHAFAQIIGAAGAGTVMSQFFNTTSGFMLANMDTHAHAFGSDNNTATEATDAVASASGNVSVEHRFDPPTGGPETLTIEDGSTASSANVEDEVADDPATSARSFAWTNGFLGWTDEPNAVGQAFGARLGLYSVAFTEKGIEEDVVPSADASAGGAVDLNFVYRPIAEPVFGFTGNVAGFTEAESQVDQGTGRADAVAGKGALGISGTQIEFAAPLVAAWLTSSVDLRALSPLNGLGFTGSGSAIAVNPAVLGEEEFDPDPAMTALTQFGTYSAAMGSSSEVNAEVTSQASVSTDGPNGFDVNNRVTASSVGFAIAAGDAAHDTAATVDGIPLYDLDNSFAFVGQGSFVGADEPTAGTDGPIIPNVQVNATAEALNLFGRAATPDFFGTLDDGDSFASVTPNLNDMNEVISYERYNTASADLITGTNEVAGVSHNAFNEGMTIDPNSPWWNMFTFSANPTTTIGPYDNWTSAFLGGGGD